MYDQFEPILFQFSEACDDAKRRILLMAKNACDGRILRFHDDGGFLAPDSNARTRLGRYLNETTYLLLAPMAYFKILQKGLTSIDIQLHQNINFCTQLQRSFISLSKQMKILQIVNLNVVYLRIHPCSRPVLLS